MTTEEAFKVILSTGEFTCLLAVTMGEGPAGVAWQLGLGEQCAIREDAKDANRQPRRSRELELGLAMYFLVFLALFGGFQRLDSFPGARILAVIR